MLRPEYQDKETLEELYIKQQFTQQEIAQKYNVHVKTIQKWVKEHNLNKNINEIRETQQKYTDDELLNRIHSYVETHSQVPTNAIVKAWKGPSPTPYKQRFGSVKDAVKQAGYTPRSEQ